MNFATVRRTAAMIAWLLAVSAPPASANELKVTLGGEQEIPPVATQASGVATIAVLPDRTVTARVLVRGMIVTVAHIHDAPAGKNGPIIVPLVKVSDGEWIVAPGTRLSEAEYASYRAGNLYFNIHSEAHRGGEIRGQIKP